MRTYSKPVVEIENFRLDAQFASGGCAVGSLTEASYEQAENCVLGQLALEASDPYAAEDGLIKSFEEEAGITFSSLQGTADWGKYITDFYWFSVSSGAFQGDNANSGGCYYTFVNASGKSFS